LKENKVLKDLLGECMAHTILGHKMHPTHVADMLKKAYQAGGGHIPVKCWDCHQDVAGLVWQVHRQVVLCDKCKEKEEEK